MNVTVSRTIYVDDLLPPRCRRPRGGHLAFTFLCGITEHDPAQLQHAADTLTRRGDTPQLTAIYHHPAAGFLEELPVRPDELGRYLSDLAKPDGFLSRDLPGQAVVQIREATRTTRERAATLTIIGDAVFEQIREPVYRVEYEPSFNWETISLRVTGAPVASEPDPRHPGRTLVPWLTRYFNARDHAQALALILNIAHAAPQDRDCAECLSREETDRITIFIPDLFTFDAAGWHAAREETHAQEVLEEVLNELSDPFPNRTIAELLFPERIAIATRLRTALAAPIAMQAAETTPSEVLTLVTAGEPA